MFVVVVVIVVLCFIIQSIPINGHLCETDTSVKRTPGVGPCRCLFPLFDSV